MSVSLTVIGSSKYCLPTSLKTNYPAPVFVTWNNQLAKRRTHTRLRFQTLYKFHSQRHFIFLCVRRFTFCLVRQERETKTGCALVFSDCRARLLFRLSFAYLRNPFVQCKANKVAKNCFPRLYLILFSKKQGSAEIAQNPSCVSGKMFLRLFESEINGCFQSENWYLFIKLYLIS